MSKKPVSKEVNKAVRDVLKGEVKKPATKKSQRYVRVDRVAKFKADGWKEATSIKGRGTLGVKTEISDLVLMEK